MNEGRVVNGLTLTVLVKSPVALSNDQGYGGTYIPIKKTLLDGALRPFASVSTFTYEMRKILKSLGWDMSDLILKEKNLLLTEIEDTCDEADLFGYVIAEKGKGGNTIVRKSPLRVIPLISANQYRNTTQLITNRGFLDLNFGRTYYEQNDKGKLTEIPAEKIPTAQALVTEEIHGDYYTFTVTFELNRIGRIENEIKDGNNIRLDPKQYRYREIDKRIKVVSDTLEALKLICRDIKHQNPFLRPLAIVGGIFKSPIPYFWDRLKIWNGNIAIKPIKNIIEDYKLTEMGKVFIGIDEDEFLDTPTDISVKIGEVTKTIGVKRPVPLLDEIKNFLIANQDDISDRQEALYIEGAGDNKDKWILKA